MDRNSWRRYLQDDYKEYCRLLVEKEEKLLRQGIQGELLQLFRSNQLYYRKPISKVNFESFFRFFIQIGIDYIEPEVFGGSRRGSRKNFNKG